MTPSLVFFAASIHSSVIPSPPPQQRVSYRSVPYHISQSTIITITIIKSVSSFLKRKIYFVLFTTYSEFGPDCGGLTFRETRIDWLNELGQLNGGLLGY